MRVKVVFTPSGLGSLAGWTGVVIDVLRATTTIVAALSRGCPGVLPVEVPEEASDLAKKLGREHHLLGGERRGYKLEGFDLGNSPLEYHEAAIGGRRIILCTTNGTRTIRRAAAAQAKPVLLAAFVNAPAVVEHLCKSGNDAALICSGRDEDFALEDALCAGFIASQILKSNGNSGDDGARAAAVLWEKYGHAKLAASLASTDHGQYLDGIGFAGDVAMAAQTGLFDTVPVLRDGCLVPLA